MICLSFELIAQDINSNLKKYWYMRDRLRKDFIVVSPDNTHGTNIPFSRRNTTNFDNPPIGRAILSSGDGNDDLQYYIAMLATEYRLLKDYGQDYDTTFYELTYALHAFERLDKYGETFHEGQPNLNGYFVRYDIHDMNIYENYPDHSYLHDAVIHSGWQAHDNPYDKNEMSQDNAWHYLMALALVEKLVDDKRTVIDAAGSVVTVKEWVRKISYRVLNYMRQGGCLINVNLSFIADWIRSILPDFAENWNVFQNLISFYENYNKCILPQWGIKNPVTGQTVTSGAAPTSDNPEREGGDVEAWLVHGFAEAGNYLAKNYPDNLHTEWSNSFLGKQFFKQFAMQAYHMNEYSINWEEELCFPIEPHLSFNCSSNGASLWNPSTWGNVDCSTELYFTDVCLTLHLLHINFEKENSCQNTCCMISTAGQITGLSLDYIFDVKNYKTNKFGFTAYEHFPLIWLILHSNGNEPRYNEVKSEVEALLYSCPDCGPFSVNGSSPPESGEAVDWTSPNRLVSPDHHDENNMWWGKFSGIDYMLLHNLYWLVYKDKFPMNVYINEPLPSSNFGNEIYAANNIFASSTVSGSQPYIFHANNQVQLLSGFETADNVNLTIIGDENNFDYDVYQRLPYQFTCPDYKSIPYTPYDSSKSEEKPKVTYSNNFLIDTNKIKEEIFNSVKENILIEIDKLNKMLEQSYVLYPNPSDGIVKLTFGNLDIAQSSRVEIFNTLGEQIIAQPLMQVQTQWDFSKYPKGMYLVKVIIGDQVFDKKLILQ